ncbi:aldehyde dehydrogenase family protein [Yinghuangia soli]|uniref:Aldehyde dehydrogenase n=1 Tax=Yinghuangia soli TaxID=2908204 RepID=A0AA41U292_9ACTN|nr:aldehyde dehydrogenase [Yinghuangia soli]MCF2531553.1 aldehyde dehydrogenase [Yinghuangia soli]
MNGDLPVTVPPHRDLVAGTWQPCADDLGSVLLEDPSTGEVLGPARATGPDRVEHALVAAADLAGAGAWADPDTRADVLDAVADAVDKRVPDIVALEAFATGVPLAQTRILGVIIAGAFRLAADRIRAGVLYEEHRRHDGRTVHVHRRPLGAGVGRVPGSPPAPRPAHKAASALAAGCPVILKPSELAPYGTQLLAESIADVLAEHGQPSAAFQFLHGDARTGAALVADHRVRAVSFTGGTQGGIAVGRACAERMVPAQLELGGCNPLVVMPDADPAAAAAMAVDLLTTLNGQWCRALGRLIVPAALRDPVLEAVAEELGTLRTGPATEASTEYGPLVHSTHRRRIRDAVTRFTRHGAAREHAWTDVPEHGNYLAPTLVTGVPLEAALDEVFGPVATVHTYTDLDQAVAIANAGVLGLEGYVAGTDEEAALAVAERVGAGEVKVNGSSIMSLHMDTPRPAWGMSGLGDEGTVETLRLFTGARVVGVENARALHRPQRGGAT